MAVYSDYNRTIVGFHGTSKAKAGEIVRLQRFLPSKNKHDWLGHGVYFWEHAPKQALWWAQRRYKDDAAVVGSMIRLGNCLDLLDPDNARALKTFHDELEKTLQQADRTLPNNKNSMKYRDCFVLEAYYDQVAHQGDQPIQSARGVYVPTRASAKEEGGGTRLWDRSWLTLEAHIQVCIRPDAVKESILGTWPVVLE